MTEDLEEWQEIEDWPDYLVSNYGRIFSRRTDKILKGGNINGGLTISLCKDYVGKNVLVHRLVALAFVPGYFEGAVVRHKDNVKTNNMASNLEWVTNKEKTQRSIEMGLLPRSFCIVETGDMFMYVYSCARYIGGDPDSILKCLNGTQQTHKGYHFEYINPHLREE
jgi:hypothetical protein